MALFHDYVQAAGAVTALVANRVDLGDITLPAGDWIITRVWAHAINAGALTAVEGLQGYIQIESNSCGIAPCEFLLQPIGGMLGAGLAGGSQKEPIKWLVNCPAPGGAALNVYHICDSTIATTTSEVLVTIEFARASPFPGDQVHMKVGEPSLDGPTTDEGTVNLTSIEAKASMLHAIAFYACITTQTADMSSMLGIEVKSSDFGENGPNKFGLPVQQGGDTTNAVGNDTQIETLEMNMPFKHPNQNQTIEATVTSYDAITVGAQVNWMLIYS